ncbi:hypothetical protein ACA910_008052 [Epithemia clementina (nom. ined.)]
MSQIAQTQQLQAQAAASPPPVDYGAIVTSVIETLVSKQLIQMTPTLDQPQAASAHPATDKTPATSGMDVSFAGNISHINHDNAK